MTENQEDILKNLNPELGAAVYLSLLAGRKILDIYQDENYSVEYKEDDSPITLADREANEIIVNNLKKRFPDYALLSEESRDDPARLKNNWCWIIDPLDGTKEFVKGNGEFTVNIALTYRQEPVLGVIYLPVKGDLYYALKGQGAYYAGGLDGENLSEIRLTDTSASPLRSPSAKQLTDTSASRSAVTPASRPTDTSASQSAATSESRSTATSESRTTDTSASRLTSLAEVNSSKGRAKEPPHSLTESLKNIIQSSSRIEVSQRRENLRVVKSRSHASEKLNRLLERNSDRIAEVRELGSSLKGCLIARGEAEVYYRFTLTKEWDIAAMDSIVTEAGGIMRNLKTNQSFQYNRENSLNEAGFYLLNREESRLK